MGNDRGVEGRQGRGRERALVRRAPTRLVERLEAEHTGLVLVARDHEVPRRAVSRLHRRACFPEAVERRYDACVREVGEAPVRAVVRRWPRVGDGPSGEAVAAEDLRIDVLVKVDDRPDPTRPGGVDELVVAGEPVVVVRALGRLERRPGEGEANDVHPPAGRVVHIRRERRRVPAVRVVERDVRRELAPFAGVDPAQEDDPPEAVTQARSVRDEPPIGGDRGRDRARRGGACVGDRRRVGERGRVGDGRGRVARGGRRLAPGEPREPGQTGEPRHSRRHSRREESRKPGSRDTPGRPLHC